MVDIVGYVTGSETLHTGHLAGDAVFDSGCVQMTQSGSWLAGYTGSSLPFPCVKGSVFVVDIAPWVGW